MNLFYLHKVFFQNTECDDSKYDKLSEHIVNNLILKCNCRKDDIFSKLHLDAYTYFGENMYIDELKILLLKIDNLFYNIKKQKQKIEIEQDNDIDEIVLLFEKLSLN